MLQKSSAGCRVQCLTALFRFALGSPNIKEVASLFGYFYLRNLWGSSLFFCYLGNLLKKNTEYRVCSNSSKKCFFYLICLVNADNLLSLWRRTFKVNFSNTDLAGTDKIQLAWSTIRKHQTTFLGYTGVWLYISMFLNNKIFSSVR